MLEAFRSFADWLRGFALRFGYGAALALFAAVLYLIGR